MIQSLRLRAKAIAFAALFCGSLSVMTSCSDEPLPNVYQVPEELLLTPLVGRHHNPFTEEKGSPADSGAWVGTWILNGHVLVFTAKHLAPGQVENKAFVFGYSYRVKRFFMLTVTAGGNAPDSVNVSWFTIKDKVWRFMPEVLEVGGKAVERQLVWNEKEPSAKPAPSVAAADSAWTVPSARAEMAQFSGWSGRWPNNTLETTSKGEAANITGVFDSKPLAGGHWLVWYEQNDITLNQSKRTSDREVDIWGYSDVRHLYYRVNIVTAMDGHPIAPQFAYAPFYTKLGDNGLLLAAPLYKTPVKGAMMTSRYGIIHFGDTLYVFEQYLVGGINWTNSPSRQVKWGKLKTSPPAEPKK